MVMKRTTLFIVLALALSVGCKCTAVAPPAAVKPAGSFIDTGVGSLAYSTTPKTSVLYFADPDTSLRFDGLAARLGSYLSSGGKPVICPTCAEDGETSTVTIGGTVCTTKECGAARYNESGKLILGTDLDCNTCTTQYTCSRGHSFSRVERVP